MLSGRPGMSSVMVGRAAAMRRLNDLVDVARVAVDAARAHDQPWVALVSGEAGIGKTRLVREFTEHLPDGVAALTMMAQPGSIGRSGDALTSLSVVGGGQVFAPAEQREVPPEPPTADPTLDVVASVARIRAAAGGRPAVLVVEDIHWLDAVSATVIDRVAQQVWPELVIVGTYRFGELSRGVPGGDLVFRLERRHAVEQLRLERLDRHQVGALISAIAGEPPSSAVVEATHRRSGGIPFVVEELIRCCSPTSPDDVLAAQLPWSLDEAVRQQIAGFDPSWRSVVEAMAVYGRPVPFATLVAVTQLDDAELLDALRNLVVAAVVVEVGDDAFWFVHALVSDAVERQLLGRERRRLHGRCFDAMADQPAPDPAALARHALGAGRFDEVVAIARDGAARYLLEGSTFQALRLAAEALAEEPDDPELLRIATDAAWRIDFLDEALVTARRWAAVAVDDADRISALRFLARLGVELVDPVTEAAAVTELEAMVDRVAPPLVGVAAAALAQIHMIAHRSESAIEWAERALDAARAVGDDVTATHALVERGSARTMVSRGASRPVEEMRAALEAARALDDPVLICRAINNFLDLVPPNSDEAAALRHDLEVASRRSGLDRIGNDAMIWWEAEAARSRGDLEAYRRIQLEAGQWGSLGHRKKMTARSEVILALEEGRVADARAVLDGWVDACRDVYPPHLGLFVLWTAVAEGDHATARRAFEAATADPTLVDSSAALDEVVLMVESALAAGVAPDEVRTAVFDRWLAGHASFEEFGRHADGLLLAAGGHHDEAVQALRAVLEPATERLSAAPRGTLRTVLAAELLAVGDRDDALAAAHEVVEGDLARWPGVRRDRAEALLRRLEGSSHRADGALTTREREIASLLVEGLTNGALAERLFISPKTAAVHVSNILAKLGLSSRAEIAAWAVRNGLDAQLAS